MDKYQTFPNHLLSKNIQKQKTQFEPIVQAVIDEENFKFLGLECACPEFQFSTNLMQAMIANEIENDQGEENDDIDIVIDQNF